MRGSFIVSIIFSLLIGSLAYGGLREEIAIKKQKVFRELTDLSFPVDVDGLSEISMRISKEELDPIYFRLTKEIEKVPDFDLASKNEYDLRLIETLIEIIYLHSDKDYLADTLRIKNLAAKKLYLFPLYNDLLGYQLEGALVRSEIELTNDDLLLARKISYSQTIEGYINAHKNSVLNSVDLSKAPTEYLERLSCSKFFSF